MKDISTSNDFNVTITPQPACASKQCSSVCLTNFTCSPAHNFPPSLLPPLPPPPPLSLSLSPAIADYNPQSHTVIFAANASQVCAYIHIIDDTRLEDSENLLVSFNAPPNIASGTPSSATVTIIDNDGECFCERDQVKFTTHLSLQVLHYSLPNKAILFMRTWVQWKCVWSWLLICPFHWLSGLQLMIQKPPVSLFHPPI